MIIRRTLIVSILVFLIFVTAETRKVSSGRKSSGGWGWGSRSSSRTTQRPKSSQPTQTKSQSSQSGGYPRQSQQSPQQSQQSPQQSKQYPQQSQQYPQQSAYNPYYQGGQASKPSLTQGSNPSVGQGYNPSVGGYNNHGYPGSNTGQSYNPMGHGYGQPSHGHQSYGQPSYGQPSYGQPSYGQPSYGQPSYGHQPFGQQSFGGQSYNPSFGQVPQQTILLPSSQPYKPGIGQIAKEAFVYAGVSAGVNAAVSRILPGGIFGHRESSSSNGGSPSGVTHTQITYNNYYNNQSTPTQMADGNTNLAPAQPAANPPPPNAAAVPAAPVATAAEPTQNAQTNANSNASPGSDGKSAQPNSSEGGNNPNPLGYVITNEDIKKLTEELFNKDVNNAFKYITIKLQGQKKDDSVTDDASEPLLDVKPEAYEISTIKSVLDLHNNYELDVKVKENHTPEKREKESELLQNFLKTDVLQSAMKFLASKGYIPDDPYEFKDTLKRVWFTKFKRIDGDASSSGFETVYLAEQFESDIIGLHNWIYYAKQEAEKKLDYLGYIKEAKFGDKAAILKIRSKLNGIVQPVTTIFVGTSPELEMALYTICFFTRPNVACPMSFGGTEFMIIANRVNYFGTDILVSAFPEI